MTEILEVLWGVCLLKANEVSNFHLVPLKIISSVAKMSRKQAIKSDVGKKKLSNIFKTFCCLLSLL